MNFNLDSLLNDINVIKSSDLTALENLLLDENGNLKIVAYENFKDIPQNTISQFCVKYGFYVLPTIELVDFLKEEINHEFDKTIEIGAGNGVLSRDLGIRGVDNYMQRKAEIKAYYESLRQTIVPYDDDHVERIDGLQAIKKYRPNNVIALFFTHKYNQREHWRGGNQYGIDEKKILEQVKKYIHVGNEKVHGKKPILSKKHREIKEDWIITRSFEPQKNVIWIWDAK
jgi:hypothetical protein